MTARSAMKRLLFLLLLVAPWVSPATAQTTTVDVTFRLTDQDDKPIAGAPVRIVFATARDWQSANAGRRIVTDARGEARFTETGALDKRSRKLPTNFVDTLLSRPQSTDHVKVGAELEYAGFRWLYVLDVDRFPAGDVALSDLSVFSADPQGGYTRKAKQQGRDWMMADLNGLALSGPGHEPVSFTLQPKEGAAPNAWTLQLSFKRAAQPVRR